MISKTLFQLGYPTRVRLGVLLARPHVGYSQISLEYARLDIGFSLRPSIMLMYRSQEFKRLSEGLAWFRYAFAFVIGYSLANLQTTRNP